MTSISHGALVLVRTGTGMSIASLSAPQTNTRSSDGNLFDPNAQDMKYQMVAGDLSKDEVFSEFLFKVHSK